MKMRRMFLTMSLAGGLFAAPVATGFAHAAPPLPDSDTLNSIVRGAAPKQERTNPFKKLEKAINNNMQSAQTLIEAAREAGATPQQLADMEKYSVGFLKTFLAAITPADSAPGMAPKRGDRPMPPPDAKKPPKTMPPFGDMVAPRPGDRPMPPAEGKRQPKCPAFAPGQPGQPQPDMRQPQRPDTPPVMPQVQPRQPQPAPQGIIITAPDGTQWLVTPQQSQQPAEQPQARQRPRQVPPAGQAPEKRRPPMMPPAVQTPASQSPALLPPPPPASQGMTARPPAPEEEIIIIEEETVQDMPLWPTKDQMSKDGILKYLEKRNSRQ